MMNDEKKMNAKFFIEHSSFIISYACPPPNCSTIRHGFPQTTSRVGITHAGGFVFQLLLSARRLRNPDKTPDRSHPTLVECPQTRVASVRLLPSALPRTPRRAGHRLKTRRRPPLYTRRSDHIES